MEQRELEIKSEFTYLIERAQEEAYEEKKLAAIKLIKSGVSSEIVAESLGISLSEIERGLNI